MKPLLDRAGIERLIPHGSAMSLWDELLEIGPDHLRLRTRRHLSPEHPLRRDGSLVAIHLIEYGAQAMAIHGGWLAQAAGGTVRGGMLAAVRDLSLQIDTLDALAEPLECEATRLLANANGWMYRFVLSSAGVELCSGRASVIPMADAGT